ncbi:MAG: beta-galactosidase, partial [Armatimonadota bacterium]|nr:beta-galactosidase [Armatimonadota bacterium]
MKVHAGCKGLAAWMLACAVAHAQAQVVRPGPDQVTLLRGARWEEGRITVTTAPRSGFNEFLHTAPSLALPPGSECRATFAYTWRPAEEPARAYAVFRSRSADPVNARDTGWVDITQPAGTATVVGRLRLYDDYYLLVGIEGGGTFTMSDLRLETLDGGVQVIHPREDLSPLSNPDKGWVLHFYDNSITNYGSRIRPGERVEFPGLGMVYFRLAWGYLEPEEGKYNWSLLDPWIEQFTAQGLQYGFRISCSETGGLDHPTPRWVLDAGAKTFPFANGSPRREVDFGDPVFLEKLDRFLGVFAARYDAGPRLAWLDVGSLGV